MLKRQFRLPAAVSLHKAPALHMPLFLLKVVPNDLPYSRFGFVISKRVAKRAVSRNRSKRLLRSCIEAQLRQINPGYDMLFLLKRELRTKQALCEETIRLLTEHGYIV